MPEPSRSPAPRGADRPPLTAIAAAVTACVAIILVCAGPPASGQRPPGPAGSGQLVVSTSPLPDDRHLIVVVDPVTRHAAVYVVAADGTLALKGARDLTWDLMVGEFNAQEPRPAAIRKLLEAAPPPR